MKIRLSLLKLLSILFLNFTSNEAFAVIYGSNNISSTDDLSSLEVQMSESVAAMINQEIIEEWPTSQTSEDLQDTIWSIFSIPGGSQSGQRKICDNVPFIQEKTIASCSGVLIAPQKLVTASHCLGGENLDDFYKSKKWIFNFKSMNEVKPENIYSPIAVQWRLTSHFLSSESPERKYINEERRQQGLPPLGPDLYDFSPYLDIAIVTLDRPVINIRPVQIDFELPKPGTELVMLGHPMGLTQKITRLGFVVENVGNNYTTTTLDTLKGNSGAPVFNPKTVKLLGIMVNQGLQAPFGFDRQNRCYGLTRYHENELETKNLSGFMNISLIAPALNFQ